MHLCRLTFLPLLLVLSASAATVKLEPQPALQALQVPGSVLDALQPSGQRVTVDGKPYCDIWLAKSVGAGEANKADGAAYPQLSPTVFVGVISFPAAVRDYRGHDIQPGYYTLRYETFPADGNHLGVAPNPDFFLLAPVSADKQPGNPLTFDQMVDLSKQASGLNHPAVFALLAPPSGNLPAASQNSDGYIVFAGTLKLAGGAAQPFALVVKGETQQ